MTRKTIENFSTAKVEVACKGAAGYKWCPAYTKSPLASKNAGLYEQGAPRPPQNDGTYIASVC